MHILCFSLCFPSFISPNVYPDNPNDLTPELPWRSRNVPSTRDLVVLEAEAVEALVFSRETHGDLVKYGGYMLHGAGILTYKTGPFLG